MDTAITENSTPSLEGPPEWQPKPPPTGEGLTFEKVWAMFQETDKQIKEAARVVEETAERQKETDRQMAKTDRQIARNNKQMGDLHRSFGKLAEHLVAPGIEARFNQLGYHFDEVALRGCEVRDKKNKVLAEIDILLENGETIMAVEVKANPAEQDIKRHIKRLEILRDSRIKRKEKPKKILGAIAGAIYETAVKKAAREAGFFVIEQSGDTMKIDMPKGFVPREW